MSFKVLFVFFWVVRPFGVNLRVSVYVGGETNVKTEDDAGGIRREVTSIEFRKREFRCV